MSQIDIQGHRGCRGLKPENTIPAFIHAIELGVDTLEMDAVVSGDGKIIISHEPFFNHEMCLQPDSTEIMESEQLDHNMYRLSYEEIKEYDCGSKRHIRFPEQEKLSCYKPSLRDVVSTVNTKLHNIGRKKINYNIEIKRKEKWDYIFHPPYQEFADIVIAEIQELEIMELTTVQCFDFETLKYIKRKYPKVKLVMLIEDARTPEECISDLGFYPEVYSPSFELVDPHLIDFCKRNKMKLIPWTVNESADIISLKNLGVTRIISDYPDLVINIFKASLS